ncbi:MAG: hypothetical protein ABI650_08910 [Dokdonella sp.]
MRPPLSMRFFGALGLVVLSATAVHATSTVRLPDWVCAHPDAMFVDGFQQANAVLRSPSNGSGGAIGNVLRAVVVPGYGTRNVYLRVPPSYSPTRPMPLVFALHGQAGSAAAAQTAAQAVRNAWSTAADTNGFIIIAPVASGNSGGWIAPPPGPSDYDTFAAAIADVEAAYTIDRSRRIGWGFSAGGHVMHDLVLNAYSDEVTIDTFAAYSVSAGVFAGLACSSAASCNALVAGASRRIPVDIHVGGSDSLLPYATSDRNVFVANDWTLGTDLWFTTFPGGHSYAPAHLAEIWTNLCPFQALP